MYTELQERKSSAKKNSSLPQNKSAGTAVVQRYVRAGGYTVAAPPPAGAQRQLMVRDNEASTLYMRNGAPVIPELVNLGIQADGTLVQDPLAGIANQFRRFRQGRIPAIYTRETEQRQRPIPWERRSTLQKIKFWQTPVEIYNQTVAQQGGQQPQRIQADRVKALGRLKKQRKIINSSLAVGRMLRHNITHGTMIIRNANSAAANINAQIQLFTVERDQEKKTAAGSLGLDVIKDLHVILIVANGQLANLGNNDPDEMEMLDAAIIDLEFRFSQIQNETAVVDLEPQMLTGCDLSSQVRKKYMDGQDGMGEKADFEPGDFENHIGWAYHYASLIQNNAVSADALSIEDAVGKSSHAGELANAHWFAHIYGAEETQGAAVPQNQLGVLAGIAQGVNVQQPFHNIVPDCRFNRMSLAFRQNFVQNAGIVNGSFWTIHYRDANNEITGSLRFTIRNNRIEYLMTAAPDRQFTPAMQHFLITTADSIAEDFAVQKFVRPQQPQIDDIYDNTLFPLRINHAEIPENRILGGAYKLEELHP